MSEQTTFPVSHQFTIGFNAFQDRLVLTTELSRHGLTTLLLTRRMVLLILQQIIKALPEVTGLKQTPINYWHDVLQLTHQKAMDDQIVNQKTFSLLQNKKLDNEVKLTEFKDGNLRVADTSIKRIYLATDLTLQHQKDTLILAFSGIHESESHLTSTPLIPILALSLETIHVHQVLQLLVIKSHEALWHLPIDLPPWLTAPSSDSITLGLSH